MCFSILLDVHVILRGWKHGCFRDFYDLSGHLAENVDIDVGSVMIFHDHAQG